MDQKTQRQIEAYLADEGKLFRGWYHTLGKPDADPDITPVGSLPVENIGGAVGMVIFRYFILVISA
ncbi:MAG: hypothetical protein B6245_07700 [Desulfobacteraceae bacterium 4572_88]|nr:MAG: hypothetical protein B6245_07700 [Desulfobacteraceae bacterium 4572_88]